ncbi:MAG: hypothetical protein EBU90_29360 [Proteobacteria bacterium]|nr:hypothetical protein [Pseudomonadota bacterium]
MAISILNAPAAATGSGVNAQTFTAATSYTTYTVTDTFAPGGYRITTSPSNQEVQIYFASGTTSSSAVNTSSGTVSLDLGFQATKCFIKDISGANGTVVTIEYTAESATQAAQTGTLDTITATGNYTQTGLLHVLESFLESLVSIGSRKQNSGPHTFLSRFGASLQNGILHRVNLLGRIQ